MWRREKGDGGGGTRAGPCVEGDTNPLSVISGGVLEAVGESNRKTCEEGLNILGRPQMDCAILRRYDFPAAGRG